MATQEKTWNVANRLHSLKDSDNPELNHIIAGADEIYDDEKGAKQSDINAQTETALADRYTKAETYSKEQLDSLITTPDVEYVTVATFADLPQSGEANTIYRVSSYDGTQVDASKYALYAWNGTAYQLLTVRSAVGEVFDVSEYNSGATYETLAAALAAVPASVKKGGMSIKFIQLTPATYSVVRTEGLTEQPTGTELQSASAVVSGTYNASLLSDFTTLPATTGAANAVTYYAAVSGDAVTYTSWAITKVTSDSTKYVQYRLKRTFWSIIEYNWSSVDDEIERQELIAKSKVSSKELSLSEAGGRTAVNLKKVIMNSIGVIKSGGDTGLVTYTGLLPKGTVVHLIGTMKLSLTELRYAYIGFMVEDPSSFDSLIGVKANNLITITLKKEYPIDIYFEVPYDSYLLISRYTNQFALNYAKAFKPVELPAIDDEPIVGSDNLVKSGGVFVQIKDVRDSVTEGVPLIPKVQRLFTNILEDGVHGVKIITTTPSAAETYNAYYRPSEELNFANNGNYKNRLTYFPEYIVCGGEELSFDYTGLNFINVYELTYKPLGTKPINAYTSNEIIKSTSFKSNQDSSYTGHAVVKLSKNCRRVAFVLGSAQNKAIRPSEITDNITSITLPVADEERIVIPKEEDIVDTVMSSEMKERLLQATYVAQSPTISPLGLLHFSDIHEDAVAAAHIFSWLSDYDSRIDDTICTGDVVESFLVNNDGTKWWKNTNTANKSLFVLGNHDQTYSSDYTRRMSYFLADCGEDGKGNIDLTIPKSEAIKSTHIYSYTKYFADYIDDWGVTMPTGYNDPTSPYYQACYWHKDYAAQKVRLIGVDCIYRFDGILARDDNGDFIIDSETGMLAIADGGQGIAKLTTEQETWLKNLLDETLDSNNAAYGYSVIVLCHYPLDDCDGFNSLGNIDGDNRGWSNVGANGGIVLNHRTGDTVNFHTGSANAPIELVYYTLRNRVPYSSAVGYADGNVNNIGDILQKWQDNGGNFVAWICGHTHSDKFYYPKKYPNMLCVGIDQAGKNRTHNVAYRNNNMLNNTCANYYSIDTQNSLFKIIRFGLTTDKTLSAKNYLCYNYKTKMVINEG